MKITDWKIKIPFTDYSIQHYHYDSELENSTLHEFVMCKSMKPEV